jgi:hypothetical protein
MESANEADPGGVAFHVQHGLGDFKPDQLVRGQCAANFLMGAHA